MNRGSTIAFRKGMGALLYQQANSNRVLVLSAVELKFRITQRAPLLSLVNYPPFNHDPRVSAPIVLDVEASGFDPHSYPIEVGFVTGDGKRFSRLIRPYPDWSHWCDDAEATHQLSRAELVENGTDGKQVAEELNQWLSSQTVYTDGWVLDKPWLIKLFDRARVPMSFWVSPIEMVLSEPMMNCWDDAKAMVQKDFVGTRHRASTDAWFIQQVYIKARALALERGASG